GYLEGVAPAGSVVGLAYAVDGKVRAVRWFANSAVFKMYQATLINTAAIDAITAQAQRAPGQPPPPIAALGADAVSKFIASVETARVDEARDTAASNVNEYQQSETAYGSKTLMKPKAAMRAPAAGAPAAPAPSAVPISADFVAK